MEYYLRINKLSSTIFSSSRIVLTNRPVAGLLIPGKFLYHQENVPLIIKESILLEIPTPFIQPIQKNADKRKTCVNRDRSYRLQACRS